MTRYFVLEFDHQNHEAELIAEEFLSDEGDVRTGHNDKVISVDTDFVKAWQDGVFVETEIINGEVFYRQVPERQIEERSDDASPEEKRQPDTYQYSALPVLIEAAQRVCATKRDWPVSLEKLCDDVEVLRSALSQAIGGQSSEGGE